MDSRVSIAATALEQQKYPKIGLALGGGAGLGWSHIGVLRFFQEHDIHVSMVSGTSIGAIVGACVAADRLDHLEALARSITLKNMLTYSDPSFKRGSVLGARKIDKIFEEHFGGLVIEELAMPFAAIASDLYTGDAVLMNKGDLVTAVKASSAVPGMLPSVPYGDKLLADGGMTDPIPTKAVWDMGADVVIAVDLQGDYAGRAKRMGLEQGVKLKRGSATKIARSSLFMVLTNLGHSIMALNPADVVITPLAGHIEMADFTKAHELIDIGYGAAESAYPAIIEAIKAHVIA